MNVVARGSTLGVIFLLRANIIHAGAGTNSRTIEISGIGIAP
jgi:hypothetical protein